MLPKRSRLSKRTIEEKLIRAPRLRTARFLVIYTQEKDSKSPSVGPQISFSASKKVAPSAVTRNLLRKRGYEAVKPLISRLFSDARFLISYTIRDTTSPISGITKELEEAFVKIGLLK